MKANRAEVARLVFQTDRRNVKNDGYYVMSIWLAPRDGDTEVGADALIATSDVEAPIGRRLRSNGTLEQWILTAVTRILQ